MRFATLVVITAVVSLALGSSAASQSSNANKGSALRTPWGEPDLQGIWSADIYDTPLERPARFAGKAVLTDEEVAAIEQEKLKSYVGLPRNRAAIERDVAGAYGDVFRPVRRTGKRTSLIVDPPDGRMPPYTPEAQKRIDAYREYQRALLQATETCRNNPNCKSGPPSPKRAELPPIYNTDRLNRADGPEDRSQAERCAQAVLPDFGGYRRIVQSPGGAVSIFYDVFQGQGWQRVIPVTASPHLPPNIRRWWGDSRGRWEGNTLVVDVANFTPKLDFRGSRENLHLVERWTRLDADTLEYAVTIDDATTWTRAWTVRQELRRQNEQANRIYYEPRCHEGNFGMAGMLVNTRAAEKAFAEGRGSDPATQDNATGGAEPPR